MSLLTSPALRYPKSLWSYNPIPYGCVLYLPLWSPHTHGLKFKSTDPFGHTCTRTPSGILHFTGSATSNVNMTAIHDAENTLGFGFWFKLDTAWTIGSGDMYLFGKYDDATNFFMCRLHSADGKLYLFHQEGDGLELVASAETSWAADTWYHVVVSCSTVAGMRLRINGGTAVTVAASQTAISLTAEIALGARVDGASEGLMGEMKEVVCWAADISAADELALYTDGTLPTHTEYWPMDEGSGTGAGAIKDQEGTDDADGALDSACTWENVPIHQRANGHYFDGFDDTTSMPDHTALDIDTSVTGGLTSLCWVKRGAIGTSQNCVRKGRNYSFSFDAANKLYLSFYDTEWKGYTADTAITSLTTWYNIATIFADASLVSFYLSGVADGSTASTFTATPTSDSVYIGSDGTGGFLNGLMGEVWIYNRALSAGEITHLYNSTKGRYG